MSKQDKEYGVTWREKNQRQITRSFRTQADADDWLEYMNKRLDTWDEMEDGPRRVNRTITYSDWADA